MYSLQVRY